MRYEEGTILKTFSTNGFFNELDFYNKIPPKKNGRSENNFWLSENIPGFEFFLHTVQLLFVIFQPVFFSKLVTCSLAMTMKTLIICSQCLEKQKIYSYTFPLCNTEKEKFT